MHDEPGGKHGGRIRDAISSEDFPRALLLWEDYANEFRQAIENRSATESQLTEMCALVEWCRTVVACARAHALYRLNTSRTTESVALAYGRSRESA